MSKNKKILKYHTRIIIYISYSYVRNVKKEYI